MENLIAATRPALVVIDSLRAYRPEATAKNENAAQLLREMHSLPRKYGCAILFVHQIRNPAARKSENEVQVVTGLEGLSVVEWLLDMEGPRALVNQSDVRLAVEPANDDRVALRIKWNRRIHGDSSLRLIERVFSTDGDAIGYHHLTGASFLSEERRKALEKLPTDHEFSFQGARTALGKTDKLTNEFLNDCRSLGLIVKLGRGRYRRSRA